MAIILNSFNGRKLLFVDLIHKFLRTSSFIRDFLNFLVKKELFSTLDYFFELLPVLDILGQPIFLEVPSTIFIPLTLRVLSNINNL